jgi:hypothetical protein
MWVKDRKKAVIDEKIIHNAALIPRETGMYNVYGCCQQTQSELLLQHHLLPTPHNGAALLTLNLAVTSEAFPPEQFIKRSRSGVKDCFV